MQSEQKLPNGKVSLRRKMNICDLGFCEDYKQVWDFQKRVVELRNQNLTSDTLIFVEHSHVLTLGRNGNRKNVLSDDLQIFEIERGGDATYHGPGQLVAYPIISLQDLSMGIKQYVELLEQVLVSTLECFGINSEGKLGKETGIWVGGSRKIASIGVATSHWTTYHGFALNVNSDLSYFEKIRPCGFESSIMTSMASELGGLLDMREVKKVAASSFSEAFGVDLIPVEANHNNSKVSDFRVIA